MRMEITVVEFIELFKSLGSPDELFEMLVRPPVFGPPFKLVSGDDFSAPSAILPKVQEVDNSELDVV